jgi:hypothetical protein
VEDQSHSLNAVCCKKCGRKCSNANTEIKRDINQTFVLSMSSQAATETVTSSRNIKMGSQPNFFQGIEILNLPIAPGTSHSPVDTMTCVTTLTKLSITMHVDLDIHAEI